MRTMIKVQIPVEAGNEAIVTGKMERLMPMILGDLKPEAAYFYPEDGMRTALFVVDLTDASQLPAMIEPFYVQLNAAVHISPVMNAEDLGKGLAASKAALQKYK